MGVGCVGLVIIQFCIYARNGHTTPNRIAVGVATVALFLLSVVGAVCEGSADTCRGDARYGPKTSNISINSDNNNGAADDDANDRNQC